MNNKSINTLVVGGFNTDIVALGADKILSAGELTYAKSIKIGPGGKSANMARMTAVLLGKNRVAIIGKTSKDPYGLWKLPVDALKKSGVNLDNVKIESFEKSGQFPGIALIPVDKEGRNQIYVVPGITESFYPSDIDEADEIFEIVQKNKGNLVLALELPLKTVIYAIKKAVKMEIRVLLDPGGIEENKDYSELLRQKIFLIKPNEHEIKILTGIKIEGFETAKKAAEKLISQGIENVFITVGKAGGYLFSKNLKTHIPIPDIKIGSIKDETGCGDQTIATISASLTEGKDILTAARIGILAGTLQFAKHGIVPVSKKELEKYF
ncbi:MAG TPA: PfkB family carbohydrate kinase [Xanthomonadales bacterium]|nr:PfkB family carbohydrate kinase [Xanthomonadales bacterium]